MSGAAPGVGRFLTLLAALVVGSMWTAGATPMTRSASAAAATAPSLRSASSAGTPGRATSLAIPTPAGVASGDLLLAAVNARTGTGTITPPAGWTALRKDDNGGVAASFQQAVFWKLAGSSEPASYTWTFSASVGGAGGILAYTGVDSANPIQASSGAFTANTVAITAPSLTTAAANETLVGFFGTAATTTATPPAGTTERYDVSSSGSGTSSVTSAAAADKVQASAGATGALVAQASASAGSVIGQLVALNPAASSPTPAPPPAAPPKISIPAADFNGDRKADLVYWRPSDGTWHVNGGATVQWGLPTDVPVPGDYNGNGRTDTAAWRPSDGIWYVNGGAFLQWGLPTDVPVPGDYSGDAATDIAVWRPSDGMWYVRGGAAVQWGQAGDVPVPGNYTGGTKTDFAVWRPSTGQWYVNGGATLQWGLPTDVPVPGDYDGNGTTDIAVWRPSDGTWFIRGGATVQWGLPTDVPVPADYDGDGKTDIAVWRPSDGTWYVRGVATVPWGQSGDIPTGARAGASGDTQSPTQPTGLAITATTPTSLALSWNASSDNVGVSGYAVFKNGVEVMRVTSTNFTFGSLTCGTAYTLGVEAYDAAGNRSTRASLNASTSSCADTTPPSTPTGLAAPSTTQSSVSLSWNPSIDNVGVTGYGVYRNGTLVGSPTGTSFTVSGLTCGTSSTFAVDARDAAGNRSGQASLSASTTACSPPPGGVGGSLPARLAQSTGTVFYVSTMGSDSNPGTLASPWRTIQKAMNTLLPGQKALARAGTYVETTTFSRAGTATAPITVAGYPGEWPIIRSPSSTSDTYPVRVTGSYFRVSGFIIENAQGFSCTNVYGDASSHDIEISGNEIRASQDQGILTDEGTSKYQIIGNRIHDNGAGRSGQHQQHGIYLEGNDHLVANNIIYNHPHGFGIQVYDRDSRSIIAGNTVTGAGYSGIVVGGAGGVDNIRVINNIFAFNSQYGIAHDSVNPTSSRADHNITWGNADGAIEPGFSGMNFSGGNTNADPLFVNYAARDLHVQAGSPAINAGLPDFAEPFDFDSVTRPQGAQVDIGAFER